ncbi:disease resistance protein RGA5-like [Miscanthus floridulus]|uniref:disease resistance protein RGA5-like n=1 Tax=Miscanthus floridulus TaxID=154761 RepID=UPI003459739E
MELVTGAMGSLIPKLKDLLEEEYKLQTGVKDQVRSLELELESAHAALHKVAKVRPDQLDELVKIWAREVREASYDMEDILDTYLVRVEGNHRPNDKESLLKGLGEKMTRLFKKSKERHKIAGSIEKIRKNLQEVTDRHGRFTVDSIVAKPAASTRTVDPRLSAMYREASQIIGIDKSSADLISMLSPNGNDESNLKMKIVSVVGTWNWYFIIIDDIWEPQTWERIKPALVENNHGSRIITTTRKFQVAKEADEVYKLQPLSHDNSKRLFYIRLFGHEDKCPNSHPDELSNAILKKCGAVPLAIITMASLLLGKSREEWIEVCNSPGFYGDKDERHMDNTMHILSLSYYDLPSHLKTSLLYLIVFPEDTLIDKDSLIWKWIPENFVEKKHGRWSFEVGEEYFHDLINRSMIHGVDSKVYGIMDGCRVNDMVLDLILSKSKEENFVSDGGTLSQSQARRLAPRNRKLDLTADTPVNLPQPQMIAPDGVIGRLTSLEELQIRGPRDNDESQRQFVKDLGNLYELRVLKIDKINDMNESMQIDLLQSLAVPSRGLRCLFLPHIKFPELPSWINSAHLPSLSHLEIRVDDVDEKCLKASAVSGRASAVPGRNSIVILVLVLRHLGESLRRLGLRRLGESLRRLGLRRLEESLRRLGLRRLGESLRRLGLHRLEESLRRLGLRRLGLRRLGESLRRLGLRCLGESIRRLGLHRLGESLRRLGLRRLEESLRRLGLRRLGESLRQLGLRRLEESLRRLGLRRLGESLRRLGLHRLEESLRRLEESLRRLGLHHLGEILHHFRKSLRRYPFIRPLRGGVGPYSVWAPPTVAPQLLGYGRYYMT